MIIDQHRFAVTDPDFSLVALLMHFEGGFTDSSSYARTISTTGSPTISGSAPAFGSECGDFTGGVEQYAAAASSASLSPGTGQFTLEFQLKPTSLYPGGAGYFLRWGGSTPGADIYVYAQLGTPYAYVLGSAFVLTGVVANAWNQITILRDATNTKVFVGTTQVHSGANSVNMGASVPIYVGAYPGVNKGASLIDELRLTIGVARTPSIQTAPFPDF